MLKVKVKLPDESFIFRIPKVIPFGNFQMLAIRYNNNDYLIGDGDEYLRGLPDTFSLGRKLTK